MNSTKRMWACDVKNVASTCRSKERKIRTGTDALFSRSFDWLLRFIGLYDLYISFIYAFVSVPKRARKFIIYYLFLYVMYLSSCFKLEKIRG